MCDTVVICLGNRFISGDDTGSRVFDHLATCPPHAGVEVIDGGLLGLDLLPLMEGRRRVVFADAVTGMGKPGDIVVLSREQVAEYAGRYGHGSGLPYLLRMAPQVCRPPLPEIALVGLEGRMDENAVTALAERCMEIAIHGLQ